MKPLFRLSLPAVALTSLFLLGSPLTHAADNDDQGRQAAAESLLAAMHTERMVAASTTRLLGLVDRVSQGATQGANLTPEQTGDLKKAEDEAREAIRKDMGYEAIKPEFMKAYSENFSEAEMKDLTVFYSSPAGQKLIEKQPVISERMSQLAQKKMQAVLPGIAAKLREATQKIVPPPAPGAVVPGPTAPGAPAAPAATGTLTTPVPPTTPVPATTPVPPTVVAPPVTTNPVPAIPTPLPTAVGMEAPSTPPAQ